MSKKKNEDEINFEGLSVEEYLKERNKYLAKLYHKLAAESYKEKSKESNNAVEYFTKGVSYATTQDYSHS